MDTLDNLQIETIVHSMPPMEETEAERKRKFDRKRGARWRQDRKQQRRKARAAKRAFLDGTL